LNGFDEVIAVTRLLGDEGEQDQPQVAGSEDAPAAAPSTESAPSLELGTIPVSLAPALAAASAPHGAASRALRLGVFVVPAVVVVTAMSVAKHLKLSWSSLQV